MIFETDCARETWELGKKAGEFARPGMVVALDGDLGVGKTVFTQGFAAGLGIAEPVNSPRLPSSRSMKKGVCLFTILMCTELATWRRWTRSDMRIIFTERACA